MTVEDIVTRLRAHADAIRARGVVALYLFGSAARGDARAESDVDLFFDPEPRRLSSLRERFALEDMLSAILSAKVDIGERGEIRADLRAPIEAGAVRVL
jgi:uncharacterized protein